MHVDEIWIQYITGRNFTREQEQTAVDQRVCILCGSSCVSCHCMYIADFMLFERKRGGGGGGLAQVCTFRYLP
jgi:ferredoxin